MEKGITNVPNMMMVLDFRSPGRTGGWVPGGRASFWFSAHSRPQGHDPDASPDPAFLTGWGVSMTRSDRLSGKQHRGLQLVERLLQA